ncbi:substrate-binding periplasmic protein [Agaribacterium haliotis]|uniref:substrate-binding periplasmic protein n=1 Tax=Agaribacterium haliotis TaxID=2013869 RepID=UPI000BB53E6D|nr:transporter substrate-binding domain-containing protein [Agaribacterium haliotis]
MSRVRCVLLLIVCIAVQALEVSAQIRIAAPYYLAESFNALNRGRSCGDGRLPEQHSYPSGAVELALLCKALLREGPLEFEFVLAPNYARALKLLEQGRADIAAETIWFEDANPDSFWLSEPLLLIGESEKGLYLPKGHRALGATSVDIRALSAITTAGWRQDRMVLDELSAHSRQVVKQQSIFELLKLGRADFTLLSFPNSAALTVERYGGEFEPLPGVRVLMPSSRHYAISRRSLHGKALQQRLNTVLARMRRTGELNDYLRHLGIGNPAVSGWRVVNRVAQ